MFCYIWTVGCQKFDQYIRILYPGRFILVESVEENKTCISIETRARKCVVCINLLFLTEASKINKTIQWKLCGRLVA